MIFRQSERSSIITNSHTINHGGEPEFADDFQFIEADQPEQIQSHIIGLCSTVLPQNYQYDPLTDIQVLSPMNNSLCGVKELNKKLQVVLNGRSTVCWQGSERKFLLNDKVMQIRNNYEKEVYNGDIGRVTGYDKEEATLFVNFYGKKAEYSFDDLDQLVLAYSTTIHKSQGNEFNAVIIPLTMSHFVMLQKKSDLYSHHPCQTKTVPGRAAESACRCGQQRRYTHEEYTKLLKRLQRFTLSSSSFHSLSVTERSYSLCKLGPSITDQSKGNDMEFKEIVLSCLLRSSCLLLFMWDSLEDRRSV
jgi:exodeoxyribonuclease V alpha subunit